MHLVMKSLLLSQSIPLLVLVIVGYVRETAPVAIATDSSSSLYNATDKVVVLTSQNFSATVYQSQTAWLVEFYAIWCGHCRSYADTYREVAINALPWKTVIRIAAMNCYGGDNLNVCRQHDLHGFPTIRLLPPAATFNNTSKVITIPASDAADVTKEIIKELDNMHRRFKSWPDFTPANRVIFEELYARVPRTTKLLLLIAEKRDDLTGRQIMLDFSKYREHLTIFRTTTDGRLWRKLHINMTDVPALFVILRNRTAERIPIQQNRSDEVDYHDLFSNAIRSYIQRTKIIANFDDSDYQEMSRSRAALRSERLKQQLIQRKKMMEGDIDRNTVRRKVNMVDLELALSNMFRQEVPQMKQIHGEAYDALVHWLTVLTKYFPGREPVMNYLTRLLSKVKEQSGGFSGNRFQQIVDVKTSDAYLSAGYDGYRHCAGSKSQYRGYPCALWLLFHTLTVSQYQKEPEKLDVLDVPSAIRGYVKHFFTCRQCSDNFMKETMNLPQLDTKNKQQAIIYLWQVHNHVNKRLHGDITEDPKYPKVQFPSKFLCATCQIINADEYDISNTMNFLLKYYSAKNIDTFSVLDESQPIADSSHRVDYIISKVDYTNDTTRRFNPFRSVPGIIQRYPLYTFGLFLFLLIILSRHRFCRSKGKRYTL